MKNSKSSYLKSTIHHVLFWSIYVLSEYVANYPHLEGAEHYQQIWTTLLSLPLLMLPTYFIVLVAIPNYLKKRNALVFTLVIIVSAGFVFYGRIKWLELINYIVNDYTGSMPAAKVLKNVVRDYAIIALATALYIISDWRKKEKENRVLMEIKGKSDLELLKRQLHPHFLFNTLNNIYSLSLKNSDLTGESILKLSRLLEYLVYQSGDKLVPLVEEIELVKNYIDLEKLRYRNELDIVMNVESINSNLKTAPLILLPFIENCFKHGGKNENNVFWIKINIRMFDNLLTIFIENSKAIKGKIGAKKNMGVGLINISDRLEILYPGNYHLDIEDSLDFYSIRLELKL